MKPIVLSAPWPRTLDLIFSAEHRDALHSHYEVVETDEQALPNLGAETLANTRYILGQPSLSEQTLERMTELRAVLNVESNLIDNMPYARLFGRGIHVLTTGAVFAVPVAELGLGLALDLARGITDADLAFRQGKEAWGGEGNANARLLTGATVGLIGYGDLGKALHRVLAGFRCRFVVHDPWLPASFMRDEGLEPMALHDIAACADVVFVVAAVTNENRHFLDRKFFDAMTSGSLFILLSRADVVDFAALTDVVSAGKIRAASDVFPQEPLPPSDPLRCLPGFIRSAHRAGALDVAFKGMGEMVLEDMQLMDAGLPPMRCKRAERETAARMQSRPVENN